MTLSKPEREVVAWLIVLAMVSFAGGACLSAVLGVGCW